MLVINILLVINAKNLAIWIQNFNSVYMNKSLGRFELMICGSQPDTLTAEL